MPINIETLPVGIVGPGAVVSFSSNFVGPMPTGTVWRVWVLDENEKVLLNQVKTWRKSDFEQVMIGQRNADTRPDIGEINKRDGDPVRVYIELVAGNNAAIIDSGTLTPVAWESTGQIYQQIATQTEFTGTGGYTAEDRNLAVETNANVMESIPSQINPLLLKVLGAMDLASIVPGQKLSARECRIFTGRGSMTRPSGPLQISAFGIRWRIVHVPENFGKRDGALVEYIERIAQLVKIANDIDGGQFVDDVRDIFTDGGSMLWAWNTYPDLILYDVTPGCQIEFCWMLW